MRLFLKTINFIANLIFIIISPLTLIIKLFKIIFFPNRNNWTQDHQSREIRYFLKNHFRI